MAVSTDKITEHHYSPRRNPMAKRQMAWIRSPKSSRAKPKVPDMVKAEVEIKGAELVDSVLKPKHIKPPPEDPQFNYLVDISVKWYRSYFYFCATYHCPRSPCDYSIL